MNQSTNIFNSKFQIVHLNLKIKRRVSISILKLFNINNNETEFKSKANRKKRRNQLRDILSPPPKTLNNTEFDSSID